MTSLRRLGLQHFDSWAGTFGETVTAMELSPDGAGYRLQHRFARFVNVPELMQLFRQTADIQTAEMLKLPIPKLETGRAITVRAPCSPRLKKFVETLVKRAERIKGCSIDPKVDNMLKITSEGRLAALDFRLIAPAAPDAPDSKVNLAMRRSIAFGRSPPRRNPPSSSFATFPPQSKAGGNSPFMTISRPNSSLSASRKSKSHSFRIMTRTWRRHLFSRRCGRATCVSFWAAP